ncbi:unnamed protein product [Sphagnum jensenii]|uniref:Peroxidase n=1 Tax=Sphagnum jensenii TaxID=128206 RepID=A0ABP1B116_9BRYO
MTLIMFQLPAAWYQMLQLAHAAQQSQQIQPGFYNITCPTAESIVTSAIRSAHDSDPTVTASLIRLQFHDCFVSGCDASILLTGSNSEQVQLPNLSVRGFDVIAAAKSTLELTCPRTVSCADIIALAARDAVAILGGPSYIVPTGRFDGSSPGIVNLPSPNSTVSESMQFFTAVGLTTQDMVNLLGAHTVGSAQCQFFTDRLYNFLGTGQPDPSLNTTYLATLQATCPNKQAAGGGGNDTMVAVALDDGSQFNFDTSYFTNIQNNKGLLRIDAEIGSDPSTSAIVNTLAASANPSSLFDKSFVSSIVAMGEIGVLASGTVRTVCSDIATA